MANFELKFLDFLSSNDFIKVERYDTESETVISINGVYDDREFCIWLDKSTAIKFAKTLRTEINKITESEVKNG